MNPLCCIAPVSIDRDRANPVIVKSSSHCQSGLESSIRTVNRAPKAGFSAQVSSDATNYDRFSSEAIQDVEDTVVEARDSKAYSGYGGVSGSVAGIMYKWVNYGKGWRPRWFVLEDGVLSYYKIHGPDKILMSPARDKGVRRLIGENSVRYMRKASWNGNRLSNGASARPCKPFGEIHLKVSSIRESRSDYRRLTVFTGTKTLHLRCVSREDTASWIDALRTAKDLFPRGLSSSDFLPSADVFITTEKLRQRLLQEAISEAVIKDCENIMLLEVSELQNQLQALRCKHIMLLETLRQLEAEKVELETTVVDETKEHDSCCGQGNRRFSDFYSVMSEGSASDSCGDNESQEGADVETDEEDGTFFDTKDILSSDALRSASYRSRETLQNACLNERDSLFSDHLPKVEKEIKGIQYPYVKRRDKLPEPKEREKPVGLWSIIKDNIGKDLSGVCLPVYFNEPLSSLQKCFEDLEYSYLVDRALEWGKEGNHLMRILNIAAFAVSGYASTEGRQCKPFNPLLGETYEADYPDKGLRFFSEKVHGFVQDNTTGEKVAMLFGKWDEAMYYVLGDPSTKPKGYDPMTEAVLLWERDKSATKTRYNLTPFAISLNESTPGLVEKLPPTDSRLRPDQRHLENGEYELANAEKLRLEYLQRQARNLQERGWRPRWFQRDENGCYRYMGGYWEARETGNWDGIHDIFSQSSDPLFLSEEQASTIVLEEQE